MSQVVPLSAPRAALPIVEDLSSLPMPPLGGKCWLLNRKGIFVLHKGAGTLRTLACTHAGSGSVTAFDGVPNAEGVFEEMDGDVPNGRSIFWATPAVMGSWMLDAGFHHGLTIRALGGQSGTAAMATIVWVPFRGKT